MTRSLKPQDLLAAATRPIEIAAEGGIWVGAYRTETPQGTMVNGQIYVEYRIPARLTQPWPIVMIHGGGGQGLDYLMTPDGRPGWVWWFLSQGYAVYLVDRHGHGRAPYHPDLLGPMTHPMPYEFIESHFSAPKDSNGWPRANLHTQWPGTGRIGDPSLDQFMCSGGPAMMDAERSHREMGRSGAELLDAIGPAILMTHSAGGPSGWMIADARPLLIRGIVAIEPIGPPFVKRGFTDLKWGLTAAPVTYDPPAQSASELKRVLREQGDSDLRACEVQADPPRRLPNLGGFPIVVVTGEASWMAHDNHGAVDFLLQAGAQAEHLRLEWVGLRGNGHAMMLEKNSDEVAAALHGWLVQKSLANS
ncbi:alpha/beta hydrolase [Variovorax sp. GB1P17]|uniref:alpha/beta hydrolase n=1 Tax=Variovorax sp. GB1P17 TaxID=3443740 RepID=UPI003F481E72